MGFDVKFFIAAMVGDRVSRMLDPTISSSEVRLIIDEMKQVTGLGLYQIQLALQLCMKGKVN